MRNSSWLYAGIALTLIFQMVPNGAPTALADPALSLVSPTGKSGEKIYFVASGFNGGSQVTIYWDHEPQPVGYNIPLRGSGFFIVPEYAKPGIHNIRADGGCGGFEVASWGCSAYANFTVVGNDDLSDSPSKTISLSPLKQFQSGILIQDIKCKQGLQLVIKAEDYSPACVRPDTSHILIQRGWGKEFVQTTGTESVEMTVIRITNNTGAMNVNYTGFRTVSPDILAKYPLLQSALQGADKQAEKFNKLCENSKCEYTPALPFGPAYSTKIPAATAKALIDDPDLHFSAYPGASSSIEMSYINIGGVKYIISLFSPQ